jgi:hypothetical protein
MARSEEHDDIMKLMQKAAVGEPVTGKKLKYDPVRKVFVSADTSDPSADRLMDVTPTDLQSFFLQA